MARHLLTPGLATPPKYAHVALVEAGERLVFTAGGMPLDAEGNLVGDGDPVAQTAQVLANLAATLRDVGTDLEHVVNTDVYVVSSSPSDLSVVWDEVCRSGLAVTPHTSTLLGVACLGLPGQLVEITAVAVIP